jgi:hypothetical protein
MSEKFREVAGLRGKRHGAHLPATRKFVSTVDLNTREAQRRERVKQTLSYFQRVPAAVGKATSS